MYALGKYWHPDHLRCFQCHCPLKGLPFYESHGRVYCAKDFGQLKAKYAPCQACNLPVHQKARIQTSDGSLFHLTCFRCSAIGCTASTQSDRFYLFENRPYCLLHFHSARGTLCKRCQTPIETVCAQISPDEQYHAACWTCTACSRPLTSRFYRYNQAPYCAYDFDQIQLAKGRVMSIESREREHSQETLIRNLSSWERRV